jgi:hypothetical protein
MVLDLLPVSLENIYFDGPGRVTEIQFNALSGT